jgi:hypothetical protein
MIFPKTKYNISTIVMLMINLNNNQIGYVIKKLIDYISFLYSDSENDFKKDISSVESPNNLFIDDSISESIV